jgi:hypothetical protein
MAKTIDKINIADFVNSYLATAAWVTCDSGENTEFTKQSKVNAKEDCLKFIDLVVKEFGEDKGIQLLTIPGNDLTYLAPHDFFLTRNGHGSGFWDKENIYGDSEAAILTNISKQMGEHYVYHERGPKSKLIIE